MYAEIALEETGSIAADDTQQDFPQDLHTRCDEAPPCRPGAYRLAAFAFFASFLLHACVIAGSVLLPSTLPPIALPIGESIEVDLAAAPMSASNSQSSGADTATPPAVLPEKADKGNGAPTRPFSAERRDVLIPTAVQPKKNGRTLQQPQVQAFEASGDIEPGEDAQPAGTGQGPPGEGTRHGHGKTGNGGPPVPFGAQVNPRPMYPEIARQRGQEGQVALLVNVDSHGNPAQVSIEASSGYSLLDQEAVTAIRRWKFQPASRNGEAVPGTVRVPVTFRLR